jgi:hypothetical protein
MQPIGSSNNGDITTAYIFQPIKKGRASKRSKAGIKVRIKS